MDMLRGINGGDGVPVPDMILLDPDMLRMDGREFPALLRADPDLSSSVVFVLTAS